MSTAAQKRCHYEVIGLPQTCTQDEIRSAYKKLALQRHPDKLVQSGVSSAEATAAFQELVHAYEVLSDPKERQWYDSHRSQILFSDLSSSDKSSPAGIPNLFSFFSPSCYTDYTDPKKGFYKVYSDVFDKIFAHEVNYARTLGLGLGSVKEAPLMGDLKSPYTQVNAFYGYWLGFATVMDFGWLDQWDASTGPNRKTRRLMEEDNKKLRKKARREFNETVRGLAEFVKKRDKRVVDMMMMKEKEREKKRKEELDKRKKMEREKLEKAKMFEEPEWARVQEDEVQDIEEEEEEEERKEWYCVVCGKKFKSDKQWKNHEQSKKHKEKVAELKVSFAEEDGNFGEGDGDEDVHQNDEFESNVVEGEEDVQQNDEVEGNVDDDDDDGGFESAEDDVSELEEEFKEVVSIQEEESEGELPSEMEDNNVEEPKREEKSIESDDETSILEAMISGRKGKKHGAVEKQPKATSTSKVHEDSEDEEEVIMEYNNRKKGTRKSRRAKVGKAKNVEEAAAEVNDGDPNPPNEEIGVKNNAETHSGGIHVDSEDEEEVIKNRKKGIRKSRRAKGGKAKTLEEAAVEVNVGDPYPPNVEIGMKNNVETHSGGIGNEADSEDDMKYKGRKRDTKTKNSSKSTKQKGKSKQSAHLCEQCEEEFESRNKLHKHLSDTGHASLKSR